MAKLFFKPDISYLTDRYPLKEEIDKKIQELDKKINKITRTQVKRSWVRRLQRR